MKEYQKHKKDYCVCCGHSGHFYPLDPEHTKTKASGGKDDASNICTMCRKCHSMKNNQGVCYMANRYPNYKKWLINHGWELCPIRNKWFLPI